MFAVLSVKWYVPAGAPKSTAFTAVQPQRPLILFKGMELTCVELNIAPTQRLKGPSCPWPVLPPVAAAAAHRQEAQVSRWAQWEGPTSGSRLLEAQPPGRPNSALKA
jgi:hypothetical protein